MISLNNLTELSALPHKGLSRFADIIYFDGPLLVHYISDGGVDYLYHWVDEDEEATRWIIYQVSRDLLRLYLTKDLNFRSLLDKSPSDLITVLDIKNDGEYRNVWMTDLQSIPNDYKPPVNAFYTIPCPEEYDSWFETEPELLVTSNSNLARLFAIYINLKPNDAKLGSSPEVPQMVDFLRNINTSYIAYSKANYEKRFARGSNEAELKKKLRIIGRKSTLRGVDFGKGSFGVALSPDFSSSDDLSLEVLDWMKTLPEQFQREIINIEFDNPNLISNLRESYTQEQIENILKPFLHIVESSKYKVALADKEFNAVSKSIQNQDKEKKALVAKELKLENVAQPQPQDDEREVVTLTIEKNKGQDIKKMSPKQIYSGLLSTKQVTEFSIEIQSIEWQGRGHKLRMPTELHATFDGQRFSVVEPLTQSVGEGKTSEEAVKKLKERMTRELNKFKGIIPEFMTPEDSNRFAIYNELIEDEQ